MPHHLDSKSHSLPMANLRLSLLDGLLFALMVGFGESYILAFAVALGTSEAKVGILASVPLLLGAVLQLTSPYGVRRIGSHKKWVLFTAVIQSLAFLPLIVAGIIGKGSFELILICSTVYWGAGFATGPAWNTWIGNMVPRNAAARFFSSRHRITQYGILFGLAIAGICLRFYKQDGSLWVFSLLFGLAFAARMLSVFAMSRQKSDVESSHSPTPEGFRKMIWELVEHTPYRSLYMFLFLFYISAFLSAPFVTPYLLSELKFTYSQYMVAVAALLIGKIVALPLARQLIEKRGVKVAFLVGAFGVTPGPMLWSVSNDFYFMLALQFTSGAFWTFFEVALNLIFFDRIKSHQKTTALTIYNLFNASAIVIGSSLGGWVLAHYGEGLLGYDRIFLLSTVARGFFALFLIQVPSLFIQRIPVLYRIFVVREGVSLSLRAFLESSVDLHSKPETSGSPVKKVS